MIAKVPAKGQSCCLAVLQDLQTAAFASLELHLGNSSGLVVSMFNKPDADADCRDFFRVKSVGTITCRGVVARTLKERSAVRDEDLWEMGEMLNLIDVPAHHENIYAQALRTGLVIFVLQGDGKPLRRGCRILEISSLRKPILYLV